MNHSNGHGDSTGRADQQTYRQLARELLLIGPEPTNEDLKLRYLDTLIDNGLQPPPQRKRVLIVGAGIAGLVAGSLLTKAGHDVTILEANANRVGGRIKTFHTRKGEPSPFADPAQYAEAGAMRVPSFHPLTLALIDKLGLKRRLFYNVDIDPTTGNEGVPVPPVTYRSFTGEEWTNGPAGTEFREPDKRNHTWIRTNREQARRTRYAEQPCVLNEGFHLSGYESRVTVAQLVHDALEPVRNYYSDLIDGQRINKPFDKWLDGWAAVVRDFDGFSMGRFLREYAGFSDEAVEAIGTIENMTSRLHLAFFHTFLGRSDIDPKATYWEIDGGSRLLPEALAKDLRDQIVMGHRMVRLEYRDPDRDGSGGPTGSGGDAVVIQTVPEHTPYAEPQTWTGDVAIVTIPFSSLRFTRVSPPFSYKKRRAVIETHYDQATKVLLEFSRRWWEFTEDDWKRELDAIDPDLYDYYQNLGEDPAEAAVSTPSAVRDLPTGLLGAHPSVDESRIDADQVAYLRNSPLYEAGVRPATNAYGGGSTTDNPNRFMYYPSHPIADSPGGVVLASYSWSDDAVRWDSLEDGERYGYALRNLQSVHGLRIEVFFTGEGQTQSWLRDPYAFGEAAVYTPHQMTSFHLDVVRPEGPVHFAGEHVSLKHAWIEGAVETAVRAAIAVNGAPVHARPVVAAEPTDPARHEPASVGESAQPHRIPEEMPAS